MQAAHLATVKNKGGLSVYHGTPEAKLSDALCSLYDEVDGALGRFQDEARAKANKD